MNGSHGFQFTPFGILRGDQAVPTLEEGAMSPAALPRLEEPSAAPVVSGKAGPSSLPPVAVRHVRHVAAEDAPLTGKQIVKQCKERMRVLEKALRAVPRMQEELESLRRLVEAAQRPAARVVKLAERNAGSNR